MNGSQHNHSLSLLSSATGQALDSMHLNEQYRKKIMPVSVFMAALMLTGLVDNTLVMLVYWFKRNKTIANYFMTILAIVDFLSCLIIHPYVINKQLNFYGTDVTVCKLFEFLIHFSLSLQTGILFSIAVDRYYGVCRPLKFISSYNRAVFLVCLSLACSFVNSVPLLEFYGARTMNVTYQGCSVITSVCHYNDKYDGSMAQAVFGAYILVLMAGLMLTMAVLYIIIAFAVRARRRRIRPFSQTVDQPLEPGALRSEQAENGVEEMAQTNTAPGCKKPSSHSEPSSTGPEKTCFNVVVNTATTSGGPIQVPSEILISPAQLHRHVDQSETKGHHQSYESDKGKDSSENDFCQGCNRIDNGDSLVNDTALVARGCAQTRKNVSQKIVTFQEEVTFRSTKLKPKRSVKTAVPAQRRFATLKGTKMLFLVTSIFYLSWLPFWILKLADIGSPGLWADYSTSGELVYGFVNHLYFINNAINPVIYTFANSNFREDCKYIFEYFRCR